MPEMIEQNPGFSGDKKIGQSPLVEGDQCKVATKYIGAGVQHLSERLDRATSY